MDFFKEQIVPSVVYLVILLLILLIFICVRIKLRKKITTQVKNEESYKLAVKKMERRFDMIGIIYVLALVLVPADFAKWVLIACVLIIIVEGVIYYRTLKRYSE